MAGAKDVTNPDTVKPLVGHLVHRSTSRHHTFRTLAGSEETRGEEEREETRREGRERRGEVGREAGK